MRQFFFSTARATTSSDEKLSMQLCDDGKLHIQSTSETFTFDEKDKPVFHNTSGESVVEYTGLATDGNKKRSWAKAIYQPNGCSKLHYHNERTENYYIVNGRAKVTLNNVVYELSTGDIIAIPHGVCHQVQNISANNGLLVLIVKCEPAWTIDDLHFVDTVSITSRH